VSATRRGGNTLAANVLIKVNKYDLGPEIGFSSAVRITIYIWVSTLLDIVVLQPATMVNDNICRYYGAMIPGLLSVASGVGFAVLNNILGDQALSSIANMSWTCVVLRATRS